MTTLSTVTPDYNGIRQQLQSQLGTKGAWTDQVVSSTGQTLIDFMASIGAFDQFSIESAVQEQFFDTQKFESSIFAKARTLGVRLARRIPGGVDVEIVRDAQNPVEYVPAYTQFECGGKKLFNREALILTQDVTRTRLYQGEVKAITTKGLGSPFQRFIVTERNFVVSDVDTLVLLDGAQIEVTKKGLWHYAEKPVVQDLTTREGQLVLNFGNDYYGTLPPVGSVVAIRYVITEGADGNDSTFAGNDIKCEDFESLKGTTLSGLQGGANQPDPRVYQYVAPHIYSSGDKALTHNQYNAKAAGYPGVIDALVLGQRYLAPSDFRYMNLARVSLLTTTPWATTEWEAFVEWFYESSMHNLRLYREDPRPRDFATDVEVVCKSEADLTEVKRKVTEDLVAYYALTYGSLGRKIYISDIYDLIRESHEDIHHVNLRLPEHNIIPNLRLEGFNIDVLPPSAGKVGTLGQTSYTYWVTAVSTDGVTEVESLPEQLDATLLNPGEYARLSWDKHPYATKYRVYGRTRTGRGLLVETTNTFFEDFGTILPTEGDFPTVDTTGVFYPNCTSINVITRYVRDTVRS